MNPDLCYEVTGNPVRKTMICFLDDGVPSDLIRFSMLLRDAFREEWKLVICTGADSSNFEQAHDEACNFVTGMERITPGCGVVLLGIYRSAILACKVQERLPQIIRGVVMFGAHFSLLLLIVYTAIAIDEKTLGVREELDSVL